MEHILQHMRIFSQQCVEILSEIVGIDVSIVDENQIRIAGSGRIKKEPAICPPMVILPGMQSTRTRPLLSSKL